MIIDIEKTLKAFADDREILNSVLAEFISKFEELKTDLASSIENRELEKVRISTHTIKGLAGTFYFEELKQLAGSAEAAALDENIEKVEELKANLFLRLDELFDEAKRILDEK